MRYDHRIASLDQTLDLLLGLLHAGACFEILETSLKVEHLWREFGSERLAGLFHGSLCSPGTHGVGVECHSEKSAGIGLVSSDLILDIFARRRIPVGGVLYPPVVGIEAVSDLLDQVTPVISRLGVGTDLVVGDRCMTEVLDRRKADLKSRHSAFYMSSV